MIFSIKSAEIRITAKCLLDEDTKVPDGFVETLLDPGEDYYVKYTFSGPINMTQLEEICKILGMEAT